MVSVSVLLASASSFSWSPALVGTRRRAPFVSFPPSSSTWTSLWMASTVTRLPDSCVEVSIVAPGTATQAAFDKACAELSRELTIPGFRKGSKIPPAVLENALAARGGRNAIRVQAVQELAQQLVAPAVKEEHGLDPIGQPTLVPGAEKLADEDFVPGKDLTMVVRCDVWPEVAFKGERPYVGLKGTYKRAPYDQKKFDVAMKDLKERFAETEPIDDQSHALENGDACVVNMVGFLANEDGTKGDPLPADVASGDNVEVVLGEGRYMEGLVEGLLGASVGQTKQIQVTFPEKLRNKDLAGRAAIFDVTIQSASKRSLPELTDEFANKVRAGLTAETLVKELQKAVDEEDSKRFVGERNQALSKSLAEVVDMEVPDTLVTSQARDKYAQMMTEFRDQGTPDQEIKKLISPENFLKYKDIYKVDIIRDFSVSMAVEKIAELENIEVPQYMIDEQMANLEKEKEERANMGEEADDPPMDDAQMKQRVETTIQSRLVFDFLAENSNLEVEFVEEEYDEDIMNKLAQDSLAREGIDPNSFTETAKIQDAEIVE